MWTQKGKIMDGAGLNAWRERIVGIDEKLPLLDGSLVRYINLDNAASTPPMARSARSDPAIHAPLLERPRGTGFKSRVSTAAYDQAHQMIARFVGTDPNVNTVIFGKNTTEAI
jgi:cysteine desulfurase / selenocysteine lyase